MYDKDAAHHCWLRTQRKGHKPRTEGSLWELKTVRHWALEPPEGNAALLTPSLQLSDILGRILAPKL